MKGSFLGNEYFNMSRVASTKALIVASRFIRDSMKNRIGVSLVKTGSLYNSIKIDYITAYRARIGSDLAYAAYQNYGTGIWGKKARYYIIRARKAKLLRFFIPKVGWISTFKVYHPGVKPIRFLENTLLEYKHSFRF